MNIAESKFRFCFLHKLHLFCSALQRVTPLVQFTQDRSRTHAHRRRAVILAFARAFWSKGEHAGRFGDNERHFDENMEFQSSWTRLKFKKKLVINLRCTHLKKKRIRKRKKLAFITMNRVSEWLTDFLLVFCRRLIRSYLILLSQSLFGRSPTE